MNMVKEILDGFAVKTVRTIKKERVSDLLCSAFEGGSNYWYRIEKQQEPPSFGFRTSKEHIYPHLDYPLNFGGYLIVSDYLGTEPGGTFKKRKLNLKSIMRGLRLLSSSEDYAHHWRDFIEENDDATTGDVFLQFCLFGDVVYS